MAEREAFDELWGSSGGAEPRPGFEPLAAWLSDTSEAELDRRQEAAEVAFRNLGITFNVYGEEEAAERIIPFDIVPRIFTADEWDRLSAGLEQRVRAINAFIGDIYGERRIIADGVVPAEIVLANPQFCVAVAGARPPHDIYAHVCGIDLVRTGPDQFFVLEDNARTPSGVSYMIENREAMLRLCPDLFDRLAVRPIDNYPDLLRETLHSVAPHNGSEPVAVLLTPGHFNSAFYEHSFLADQMGIELVEGSDLEVHDDVVYMRTIDGRVRVDVIYRRIDDACLGTAAIWCSARIASARSRCSPSSIDCTARRRWSRSPPRWRRCDRSASKRTRHRGGSPNCCVMAGRGSPANASAPACASSRCRGAGSRCWCADDQVPTKARDRSARGSHRCRLWTANERCHR